MTALAADRLAPEFGPVVPQSLQFPIADNVKIYEGALVMIVAGAAKPAAADSTGGAWIAGIARKRYDNTLTNHAAGSGQTQLIVAGDQVSPVDVMQGVFPFPSGTGANAITASNVGSLCYASDDNVVNLTSNNGLWPLAGVIVGYDVASTSVLVAVYGTASGSSVQSRALGQPGILITQKYTYDFAVNGGDYDLPVAGIPLTGPALPAHAIVVNAFLRVITPLTGGTNASLFLVGANDIVSATATSGEPWDAADQEICVPVFATDTTWLNTGSSAVLVPTLLVTASDLSAGKFNLFLQYVVADG